MNSDSVTMKIRYSLLYLLLIQYPYNKALVSQNKALASQKTRGVLPPR